MGSAGMRGEGGVVAYEEKKKRKKEKGEEKNDSKLKDNKNSLVKLEIERCRKDPVKSYNE